MFWPWPKRGFYLRSQWMLVCQPVLTNHTSDREEEARLRMPAFHERQKQDISASLWRECKIFSEQSNVPCFTALWPFLWPWLFESFSQSCSGSGALHTGASISLYVLLGKAASLSFPYAAEHCFILGSWKWIVDFGAETYPRTIHLHKSYVLEKWNASIWSYSYEKSLLFPHL